MSDVHNSETRSYNMSRIKGQDTKPELLVRQVLTKNKFRYRLHVKTLPGRPDIVLGRSKIVIQVNGCFWHGHAGCQYFKIPGTNSEWWQSKIIRTKSLDEKNKIKLKELGWRVIEIWECELKPLAIKSTVGALLRKLKMKKTR